MSLDNVVALAAAANGSLFFLALGLLLSIPLLMWGSMFVAALLKRYPILITAGGVLLGWIAGDIATADPILADWLNTDAPALSVALPLLVAIFVLIESPIVEEERRSSDALASVPPSPPPVATAETGSASGSRRVRIRRCRRRHHPADARPAANGSSVFQAA